MVNSCQTLLRHYPRWWGKTCCLRIPKPQPRKGIPMELDKEALPIIFGVKKYHQYLLGRRFGLKTDHKPLTDIFSESRATPMMASERIQRWALTLSAYSYTITYKKGEENASANALSLCRCYVSNVKCANQSLD